VRVLLLIAVVCAGCGDDDARPVQLQLINRGSCSPTNYDLSCMQSLHLQMFTDDEEYRGNCS